MLERKRIQLPRRKPMELELGEAQLLLHKPGIFCRAESEYTPGGEYNCRFGNPSGWTSQKRSFCCSSQGIGCNSGGPSIGRRLANLVGLDSLEEDGETTATELLNWTY